VKARRWLGAAALLAAVVAAPGTGAAADTEAAEIDAYAKERAAAALEAEADAYGALGVYYDAKTSEYVVVVPKGNPTKLTNAQARATGVSARVESRATDRKTLDRVDAALLKLRPTLEGFGYSWVFDPESGQVKLWSDAPRGRFEDIEQAFPGLIAFSPGIVESTVGNWQTDAPPHWGGARLSSNAATCTSGFAIKDANNTKWMVTAGHCFANGTDTNMGKVLREAAAFPALDIEIVRNKTYAGFVYADGATLERRVNDGNDPVINSSYCFTGNTSGFRCGYVAKQKGVRACYPNVPQGCMTNLVITRNPNATFQPGDSGGPFYIKGGNNTVGIRGIVSGRLFDAGCACWNSYVQGYRSIADYYIATVVTN
jgi:hypothetical protein